MDINNIKLNKILGQKVEVKNQEKETFQIPEDRRVSHSTMNKFRNAAAAYAMAAMALSSCVQQEQSVDTSGLEALLTQMMQQQKEDMAALNKLMKENNADNKEIIKLLNAQYAQQEAIYAILTDLYSDFTNFDERIMGAIYKIQALLEKANSNDEEFKDKLDDIINGYMSNGEKLDAILEANKEQNEFLLALTDLMSNLGSDLGDLGDLITNFHDDYKNGDATKTEMLQNIFNALLTSNDLSKEQIEEIKKLQAQLENGSLSDADVLEQIKDILANIDNNVTEILAEVKNLTAAVNNLAQKVEGNQDESLAILKNINDGIGSIGTKLDQVENNQKADNKVLVQISDKIDKIGLITGTMSSLTKEDLIEVLGPLYTDISEIKDKIDGLGKNITAAELEAILNAYKTDLTKTNSLIETLTKVVQNLTLGDGSGSGDVSALAAILNEIKTNDEMSRAEINEMLAQIIEKLGSIDDSLKALQATANSILENQEEFMAQAINFGTNYMAEIQKIANNTGNLNKLEEYADNFKKALVEAEKTRQEQKAILQAILEKEGSNGSISIDELKDILPDYTDILNEISEKLGNVITSSDLENYYMKTQPDLTKTNSLIETLTKVVQNKEFSGGAGSADMSRVESLLGEILDSLNNKKLPTEAQMQALLEAAQKVVNNTSSSGSDETRALAQALKDIQNKIYNKTFYYPGWDYSNGNVGDNYRA